MKEILQSISKTADDFKEVVDGNNIIFYPYRTNVFSMPENAGMNYVYGGFST